MKCQLYPFYNSKVISLIYNVSPGILFSTFVVLKMLRPPLPHIYRGYARYVTNAFFTSQNVSRTIFDVKPGHIIYNM